jgi:hypothetical protein
MEVRFGWWWREGRVESQKFKVERKKWELKVESSKLIEIREEDPPTEW